MSCAFSLLTHSRSLPVSRDDGGPCKLRSFPADLFRSKKVPQDYHEAADMGQPRALLPCTSCRAACNETLLACLNKCLCPAGYLD